MSALPIVWLNPGVQRRLRHGHLWVYSNEIDIKRSPLRSFQPGDAVLIHTHDDRFLARGYINPHSLIACRVLSRHANIDPTLSFIRRRVDVALAYRERIHAGPYYRLIYGESDGLPGLVVDRYGDYLVVQIGTAGMERLREDIIAVLDKAVKPRGILFRNDIASRELEGLEQKVEVVFGEVPETLEAQENGLSFALNPHGGQKTGWFYDQRINREQLARFSRGARVLDVFSYLGAWGLGALQGGAKELVCVDSSHAALEGVGENANRNALQQPIELLQGDAFEVLKAMKADKERFDIIVLDPPAFIKRRKDVQAGLKAYRRLNSLAMEILGKDGLLVSASCSHHLQAERLDDMLSQSADKLGRFVQRIHRGGPSPDHPVHPAMPETEYLKAVFMRLRRQHGA